MKMAIFVGLVLAACAVYKVDGMWPGGLEVNPVQKAAVKPDIIKPRWQPSNPYARHYQESATLIP